jgi:cation diffusion facilitator CzcD-associated flavoprotein CzcO
MSYANEPPSVPGSASDPTLPEPEALREKYRQEREKRLRPDGNAQYLALDGSLAHYLDDPYAEPGFSRAPLNDEVEVVVIGGGFGGLLAAARLRQAGIGEIRVIEKGADFGGAWYWNRYPGAACDIESYIYLPLLEEVGYIPVEKYSRQPEILAHSQAIGRAFGLYADACFQTEVTDLRWDESAARWIVHTNRGDAMRARFVCMANGPLHKPKLPGIPGVESFKGRAFHTSRWDYAYTGGDANGGLSALADKNVGIIGTGASAVQVIPHLGASAGHLFVFQRTPSSIDVRNNRPTDPDWAISLEPGWQQKRMENFHAILAGLPVDEDLVGDGWTDFIRAVSARSARQGAPVEDPAAIVQLADYRKMEQLRARVDAIVRNAATAEALKPYYNRACKRPCFHDDYLATFNRPNVTLVDTNGRGVDRVTERGVVAGGREYALDCLIYATGFEVGTAFARRAGYEIHGRNGVTLSESWAGGAATLHGMQSRGFPNCFVMSIVQAGATANFPHMFDEQAKHIAYIVGEVRRRGVKTVEPSEAAQAAWVDEIVRLSGRQLKFLAECTPGYLNNEGMPHAISARNGFYGGGAIAFFKILENWRAEGRLEGLELSV